MSAVSTLSLQHVTEQAHRLIQHPLPGTILGDWIVLVADDAQVFRFFAGQSRSKHSRRSTLGAASSSSTCILNGERNEAASICTARHVDTQMIAIFANTDDVISTHSNASRRRSFIRNVFGRTDSILQLPCLPLAPRRSAVPQP